VADAFCVEEVHGVLDLFGSAGFSGVGEQVQAVFGGEFVGREKIGEGDGEFVTAEAEGNDAIILEFDGGAGNFHGGSGAELTDGVEDELDLRAGASLGVTMEDFFDRLEIRSDILLTEKHDSDRQSDFGIDDALFVQSDCRVFGELGVVVGLAEERGGPFVEFEELGEAAEVVARGEFVGFERDGIFFGEGLDALRSQHAFEVQVEFGLGELAEEQIEICRTGHSG